MKSLKKILNCIAKTVCISILATQLRFVQFNIRSSVKEVRTKDMSDIKKQRIMIRYINMQLGMIFRKVFHRWNLTPCKMRELIDIAHWHLTQPPLKLNGKQRKLLSSLIFHKATAIKY